MAKTRRLVVETIYRGIDKMSRVVGKMQRRIARFTRRVRARLRSIQRTAGRMAKGIGGALKKVALVGGVAFGAVAIAVDRVTASMDKTTKMARALKMPVEELQKWQFAAEQSGVSSDDMDKALKKLTKGVGELKLGTGDLMTKLKKDPLFKKELKNAHDTSDALGIVFRRFQGIEDQTKKVALAHAMFGRKGTEMLNLMGNSMEELQELFRQKVEAGIFTEEQGKKAEAFQDAVNRLKHTFAGLMQFVVADALPILMKVIGRIRDWMIENRKLVAGKITSWLKWISENFESIWKWGKRLIKVFIGFGVLVGILKTAQIAAQALNAVLSANPIFLILSGLAGAAALTIAYWDELEPHVGPVLDSLSTLWDKTWTMMGARFDVFKDTVKVGWNQTVKSAEDAANGFMNSGVGEYFLGTAATIRETWGPLKEFFAELWEGIKETFQGFMDWLESSGVTKFFKDIADTIASGFGWIADKVSGAIGSLEMTKGLREKGRKFKAEMGLTGEKPFDFSGAQVGTMTTKERQAAKDRERRASQDYGRYAQNMAKHIELGGVKRQRETRVKELQTILKEGDTGGRQITAGERRAYKEELKMFEQKLKDVNAAIEIVVKTDTGTTAEVSTTEPAKSGRLRVKNTAEPIPSGG